MNTPHTRSEDLRHPVNHAPLAVNMAKANKKKNEDAKDAAKAAEKAVKKKNKDAKEAAKAAEKAVKKKNKMPRPFGEALATARSTGLKSSREWHAWSQRGGRLPDMPAHPDEAYKHLGWQGWGHWLGTGNTRTKTFLPFDEALAAAHALGLGSRAEWSAWCAAGLRPSDMPASPKERYKDAGWQGWKHWLGNSSGQHHTRGFLPFDAAQAKARALSLSNMREWRAWCKRGARPPDIPADPSKTYKDHGWQGWDHWLTGVVAPRQAARKNRSISTATVPLTAAAALCATAGAGAGVGVPQPALEPPSAETSRR